MPKTVIKIENLSKQYRLGVIGTGTLTHDLNRWWARVRGKQDPTLKIGQKNIISEQLSINSELSDYVWALKNINLEIKEGEIIGIIGKNGAGKSTLLKLLSRVTAPTKGSIKIKGRIASLLEIGTGFHPELTGRENIFLNGAILGMTKQEIRRKFDEIIDFAGVEKYIDTPVKRYSSGMHVRLGFAVAAHLDPEILVVDEVLAVGDAEFQKKAIGKMKDVSTGQGRTVLFVSHNMSSIKQLCTKCALLSNGQKDFFGNTKDVINKYLSKNIDIEENGIIPINASQINNGKAKFTRIELLNHLSQQTVEIPYAYKINLLLSFDVFSELKDVMFDIKIMSNNGIIISQSLTAFETPTTYCIKQGKYKMTVNLDNYFHPGLYSFAIGIHEKNGRTIEYIEDIYKFTILKIAQGIEKDYKFNWTEGFLKIPSQWRLNKI